jgi:hypothetical protein
MLSSFMSNDEIVENGSSSDNDIDENDKQMQDVLDKAEGNGKHVVMKPKRKIRYRNSEDDEVASNNDANEKDKHKKPSDGLKFVPNLSKNSKT